MTHTYLFEEGVWQAHGIFLDEHGQQFPLEGQTTISHDDALWKNVGFMRVLSEPPMELQNTYEIQPVPSSGESTTWTSYNPGVGELVGQFVVIHDSILSLYSTPNREFTGMESLRQIHENAYQNRGVLMKGEQKISSWAVELVRERFA
ncbi:hypothetical protein GF339_21550 [candidate division KSB3 bacterium]|uniref:Uncharacterized protein n=1 Tax=candidate division KSB3 bacterium TaxID=2044937 RepID=A0A9D5K067_9BACT|nr:hypothetical protein [candidate division KSB3 bacterium]MBD3327186.1 hypothetical protein [candidate division KSB3 bacterium]